MNEAQVEYQIKKKGLTAPRITPDDIDKLIAAKQYYRFPGTTTVVCCLTLANDFTIVGDAACASPENFDQSIGEALAYDKARDKIWELEGYRLKQLLFEQLTNS